MRMVHERAVWIGWREYAFVERGIHAPRLYYGVSPRIRVNEAVTCCGLVKRGHRKE